MDNLEKRVEDLEKIVSEILPIIKKIGQQEENIMAELDKYPTDTIVTKYCNESNESVSLFPSKMVDEYYQLGVLDKVGYDFYKVAYRLKSLSLKQAKWIMGLNNKIDKAIRNKNKKK